MKQLTGHPVSKSATTPSAKLQALRGRGAVPWPEPADHKDNHGHNGRDENDHHQRPDKRPPFRMSGPI